jgi:hypothetical protein
LDLNWLRGQIGVLKKEWGFDERFMEEEHEEEEWLRLLEGPGSSAVT